MGNWGVYAEAVSGATTLQQTRAHNKVNEVTGVSASTGDDWYDPTFDAAGNMRTGPKPGAPKDSDANGRKLRNTWDAWNRLVKVEVSPTNASSWTNVITCEYDGLGRRIVKVDRTGMADVTYDYYYNGQQIVETRKDADTDPLEQFVWHTYYIDALAARYYDSDTDGSSVATHYFTHDANFNVTAVTNSSGTVQERYEYTPYGAVAVLDADFSNDGDGISDIGNGTLYTGRLLDPETGYYYYRARYYDPWLGRFVGRDPIEFRGSKWNLYEYVKGKPSKLVDPSGMQPPVRENGPGIATGDCIVVPRCGTEIGCHLAVVLEKLRNDFANLSDADAKEVCENMVSDRGWDISQLHDAGNVGKSTYLPHFEAAYSEECKGSVTVFGNCHWACDVNYIFWGTARRLCHDRLYQGNGIYLGNTTDLLKVWRLQYIYRYATDLLVPENVVGRDYGMGVSRRMEWTGYGLWSAGLMPLRDQIMHHSWRNEPLDKKCRPNSRIYGAHLSAYMGPPGANNLWITASYDDALRERKHRPIENARSP